MNVAGSGDTQRLVSQALFEESGPLQGLERSCQEREMTGQGGWKEEAVNSGLEGGSSSSRSHNPTLARESEPRETGGGLTSQ